MIGKIIRCRPMIAVGRWDNPPARQGPQQAREVGIGADGAGGDDRVVFGDTEHSFVEAPMTGFAECHAVANIVVMAFAPRNDMGCLNNRMAIRCDNADTAQGAPMIVRADNYSSKALVPSRGLELCCLDDLLYQRQMSFLLQNLTVVKSIPVDHRLFPQRNLDLRREAGLQ